ncbi:hypothetical protein ACFOPX_03270 [Helicobacter baculiformis]|uniref:Uncharacterized protein n=1 Tax=Helicobacter baculiformis TaxID=427351 RepID=A0ABV7ZG83_9HELI|nr:hypothetical protein [Helicobacter baculiformis]
MEENNNFLEAIRLRQSLEEESNVRTFGVVELSAALEAFKAQCLPHFNTIEQRLGDLEFRCGQLSAQLDALQHTPPPRGQAQS